MSRGRVEFGEREYIREEGARRASVREYDDAEVRYRDQNRVPAWMVRENNNRRPDTTQLVLRQKETETIERVRPRSPSPGPVRERVIVRARSTSPQPPRRIEEDVRFRRVMREPSRGPAGADRIRFVETRSRSPSPVQRDRIRIVEREKERAPSPAPPPRPPTPKVIKGPTIEREVITHYRDIDHGKYNRTAFLVTCH